MADFIRHRQRSLTAISPHRGNRNVIVPKRGLTKELPGTLLELVAGNNGALVGYRFDFGSLTPDEFNGETINQLTEFDTTEFLIVFTTENLGADFINEVEVGGLYTLDAASADYSSSIVGSSWEWDVSGGMVSGNTYPVTIR